jgi:hypothetical protein
MENVMEKTAEEDTEVTVVIPKKERRRRNNIRKSMLLLHFNEDYEERLEDEYLELSVLLNENTVYDFVSRNNNARSVHRQY